MLVLKNVSARLNNQARGFMPFPAMMVIIYAFLWQLLTMYIPCGITPSTCEFLSLPQIAGLSLFDLLDGVNILLAAYLLVSVWSLASEKNSRSIRAVSLWASYALSFLLLILIQVCNQKLAYNFELPDEILAIRSRYDVLEGRGLKDVLLPGSDMSQGFRKPFEKRARITVSRDGRLIRNRRMLGTVEDTLDKIRSHLSEEAGKAEREPGGASKLIVLINADRHTEFKHIHKVMQVCKEKDLGIYRIEFYCMTDMTELNLPTSITDGEWRSFYRLPDGKLDAYLSNDIDPGSREKASSAEGMSSERITIEVFREKSAKDGYYFTVDNKRYEGAEMKHALYTLVKSRHERRPDVEVTILAHEGVEYGHVIKVFGECLRAEVRGVSFDVAP